MALAASRQATVRPTASRARCVRVAAVHQPGKASAYVASAAAALLLCSPVVAAPLSINPVSELAFNPVTKTLKKLDSMDPPKGVKGPEVEGQFRSNPDKARALAAENSPAGSPEAESKGEGMGKCGCTGEMDCQCTPGQCPC